MGSKYGELDASERVRSVERVFDLVRDGHDGEVISAVDEGLPIDVRNLRGDTLLMIATYHERDALAIELLRRRAEVNIVNNMGQTAVSCAVFMGSEVVLRELLSAGADALLGSQTGTEIADQFGLPSMRAIIESYASNK